MQMITVQNPTGAWPAGHAPEGGEIPPPGVQSGLYGEEHSCANAEWIMGSPAIDISPRNIHAVLGSNARDVLPRCCFSIMRFNLFMA
jgi:hypothetical protein